MVEFSIVTSNEYRGIVRISVRAIIGRLEGDAVDAELLAMEVEGQVGVGGVDGDPLVVSIGAVAQQVDGVLVAAIVHVVRVDSADLSSQLVVLLHHFLTTCILRQEKNFTELKFGAASEVFENNPDFLGVDSRVKRKLDRLPSLVFKVQVSEVGMLDEVSDLVLDEDLSRAGVSVFAVIGGRETDSIKLELLSVEVDLDP